MARSDSAVGRNHYPNSTWDAGGAGVIKFGEFTRYVPDLSTARPPYVVVRRVADHELRRSMWRGKKYAEYYDAVGHSQWFINKFENDEKAIAAWERRLREMGVMV